MTVDPHLARITEIIPLHSLRAGHRVVPVLDVRADEVEDAREWRDQEIADIVLCVDPQRPRRTHVSAIQMTGYPIITREY
jgi:hypothetical protein